MATIEWRGLRYTVALCKRIGNAWECKCPHPRWGRQPTVAEVMSDII